MGKLSSVLKSIDMAKEARMARAKEQGFDVNSVRYHGTNKDIEEFESGLHGEFEEYGDYIGEGIFTSDDPLVAERYAKRASKIGGGNPVIYPVYTKTENPLIIKNLKDYELFLDDVDISKELKNKYSGIKGVSEKHLRQRTFDEMTPSEQKKYTISKGYDGLVDKTYPQSAVFEPSQIRSTQAAFDPAKKESSNLLAGQAGIAGAVGLGAAGSSQEAEAGIGGALAKTYRGFKNSTGDNNIDDAASIVEMSPDEYLQNAFQATDGSLGGDFDDWMQSNRQNSDTRSTYAEDMAAGDEFPMPYIDLKEGSQDGRNRAMAAKIAGIDSIPVAVVPDISDAEKIFQIKQELDGATGYKKSRLESKLENLTKGSKEARMARAKESSVSYDANYQDAIDIEAEAGIITSALKTKYPDIDFRLRESDQGLTLDKVVVPEDQRNTGIGSAFMDDLGAMAKESSLAIGLTPSADFGGNKKRLEEFYKNKGFVINKGRNKDFEISETMYKPAAIGGIGIASTQSQEAEANVRDKVKSYVTKRAVRGGRDKTLAESALSILEPAAVIGSSYAKDVAAGLGGIVAGIDPYSPRGSGAAMVKHLQKNIPTYMPRTEAGMAGLEALGGAIESGAQTVMESPAGPYINQAGKNFNESADYLAEEVHPAAGAALKSLPELL